MNVKKIVDFENPPLIEVYCSVRFQPLKDFATPHIGILWQKYQPEFLYYKEQAPIVQPSPLPEIYRTPPLPRIWFTNEDESLILQLQKDRFLVNWRKVKDGQKYPHFGEILDRFESNYSKLVEFLKNSQLILPEIIECELTYINIIPEGQGWSDLSNLSFLSPAIGWNWSKQKLLPNPEGLTIATACQLPNLGLFQLNLTSVKHVPENKDALQLTLGIKHAEPGLTSEAMHNWFLRAHDSIVNSFMGLIDTDIQKEYWKVCPEQYKKKSVSG